jgi:hypothetical protein
MLGAMENNYKLLCSVESILRARFSVRSIFFVNLKDSGMQLVFFHSRSGAVVSVPTPETKDEDDVLAQVRAHYSHSVYRANVESHTPAEGAAPYEG